MSGEERDVREDCGQSVESRRLTVAIRRPRLAQSVLLLTQPVTAKQEYSTLAASTVSVSNHACRGRRSSPYPWDRPRLSRAPGSGSKSNSPPRKHPRPLITLVSAQSSSAPFPLDEIPMLLEPHLYLPRPRSDRLLRRRHPQTRPWPAQLRCPSSNTVSAALSPELHLPHPTSNARPWQLPRLRGLPPLSARFHWAAQLHEIESAAAHCAIAAGPVALVRLNL